MRMDLRSFGTGREEDDSIACRCWVDQVRHGDRSILSERLNRRSINNQLTVVRPTRRNRGCCFCGEARNRRFPGSRAIDIKLPFSFIEAGHYLIPFLQTLGDMGLLDVRPDYRVLLFAINLLIAKTARRSRLRTSKPSQFRYRDRDAAGN